jgi:type II secretory pathway component HofQ
MKKKITFEINEEVYQHFEKVLEEANKDFNAGKIHPSTLISEMILEAKVDIESLRVRNVDLRKYLRVLADQDSLDLDSIVASMRRLKGKTTRSKSEGASEEDV